MVRQIDVFTEKDVEDILAAFEIDEEYKENMDLINRLFHPEVTLKERDIFAPQTFGDYIGQEQAKEAAQIMIEAARIEHRPLPNIMIDGPFGLGKTTLARLILQHANLPMRIYDGATIAQEIPTSGTIIIDEIHNLPPEISDTLNVILDQGLIHVIGCTTHLGALSGAFRSRFRSLHLEPYTVAELTTILSKVVQRKGVIASTADLTEVAKRSRFTARTGINYLATIFDYMAVRGETVLNKSTLKEVLGKIGVDANGYLKRDRQYMAALKEDRPVGLQYLEAVLNIDHDTIEEEVEPYLLRMGLIDRTPRGRIKLGEIA